MSVVPILVAISYPAVFVAGGISLALAPSVFRSGRRSVRLGWTVFNLLLVATFVAVYLSCTVFQATAIRENYRNGCWAESFPPLDRPWMLPIWLLDIHTGTMMAYPAGDRHGASAGTLLCVIAGCVTLYRQGRKTTLAVLIAPFALGLFAAFLGRYPYGGAPGSCSILPRRSACSRGWDWRSLLSRIRRPRLHRLAPAGNSGGFGNSGGGAHCP